MCTISLHFQVDLAGAIPSKHGKLHKPEEGVNMSPPSSDWTEHGLGYQAAPSVLVLALLDAGKLSTNTAIACMVAGTEVTACLLLTDEIWNCATV